MGVTAKYEGHLTEIVAKAEEGVQEVLDTTAATVKRTAQRLVRKRRDRRLHNSLRIRVDGPTSRSVEAGTRQAFYGQFEEFGTRHKAPKPFMVPAAELQREPFARAVRELFP